MTTASSVGVGTTIGADFAVEQPLGSGGMGRVFVVLQKSTGIRRALKVMQPEIASNVRLRERFLQEARVGASIASDHVVQVITAGIDQELKMPFLVMELLEGEELAARIHRNGPTDAEVFHTIFAQLCHAVGSAHRVGVVHRDLKPENIFLARSRGVSGSFSVKVLDFGIAKVVADARIHTTEPMGTPMWMAPEQTARGTAVSPQTDVWALGLIAFFCLTGHSYWSSVEEPNPSLGQIMREMLVDELVAASKRAAAFGIALPSWFDAWFARCVHRDPKARFSDAMGAYAEMGKPIVQQTLMATERMQLRASHGVLSAHVSPTPAWNPATRRLGSNDGLELAAMRGKVASRDASSKRGHDLGRAVTLTIAGAALAGLGAAGVFFSNSELGSRAATAVSTRAEEPEPANNIVSLVSAWNDAHATKGRDALARLYDASVFYYGTRQSRGACVASKMAFFAKNPDFSQEIEGEIRVSATHDGPRADFIKRVLFHGKMTEYPSYLVFSKSAEGWKIVTEGDTVTDTNLQKRKEKLAAVEGNFDGDGVRENVRSAPPKFPEQQAEDRQGDEVKMAEASHSTPATICTEPQVEAERRARSAGIEKAQAEVEARDIGDLDGDGKAEFAIDEFVVRHSLLRGPFRLQVSTTLLGRDARGCARELLRDASGRIEKILPARTLGWRDLEMVVAFNWLVLGTATCIATLGAQYDGAKYQIVDVLRVEQYLETGGEADLTECRKYAAELITN